METFSIEKLKTNNYNTFTKNGKQVVIIDTDGKNPIAQVTAIIQTEIQTETTLYFDENGKCIGNHDFDLHLEEIKRKPEDGETIYFIDGKFFNICAMTFDSNNTSCLLLVHDNNFFFSMDDAIEKIKQLQDVVKY